MSFELTRITNRGLIYLRRSGKRQETSLYTQLEWATREAAMLEVTIDATASDLEYMRAHSLHSYKSIRLDDGITGSDPTRPGFMALIRDARSDPSISHVLIYRRDRFSRPEDAIEAVQTEKQLWSAGVTVVFSNKTIQPGQRGKRDAGKRD